MAGIPATMLSRFLVGFFICSFDDGLFLLRLTNANEVKPNKTLQLRVAVCNIQISSSVSCLYHTPTGRRSLLAAGGHRERLPGQNMAHQEQGTSLCFMASLFYHLFLRIVLI